MPETADVVIVGAAPRALAPPWARIRAVGAAAGGRARL